MFIGGNPNRLLGPMPVYITEPNWDWLREAPILARRAQDLVCNDAFSQGFVLAMQNGTHGPQGLRLRSLAALNKGPGTTTQERQLRCDIEELIQDHSDQSFDAAGLLTRKQMEKHIDWMSIVLGEGFAQRVDQPGTTRTELSELTSRWRIIRPERVTNPDLRPNDDTLFNGLEVNKDGSIAAIWVEKYDISSWGVASGRTWQRVPFYAPDGTPNVVRKVGLQVPGMMRGVTKFAPLLLLSKQLRGTIEAHVTGKRAQACTPVIYAVEDPEEAAAAAKLDSNAILGPHTKFEPLQVYYSKIGSQVIFPDFKFNGADMAQFMSFGYRLLCAAHQMPVEVVLCQMGDASLSSARAGLDQYDRTCQDLQNDHIDQVSKFFDEVVIREGVARDRIKPGPLGLKGLLKGRYCRPPKYSTDKLKDANTAKAWIANGRSKTSVFAEFGYDFEDEREEAARDKEFEESLGFTADAPAGSPQNPQYNDDGTEQANPAAPPAAAPTPSPAKPQPEQDDESATPAVPAKGAA